MQQYNEQTCVIIKPDGVKRKLIGEIIRRIEQRDLQIVAIEMFQNTRESVLKQYPSTDAVFERLGNKGKSSFTEVGWDVIETFGTDDAIQMGKQVHNWLVTYLCSAPMVKMVVSGPHAIAMVRKIIGTTMPYRADMGTVRGDYSTDSPAIANREKRVLMNIVHASEDMNEAENEIGIYFDHVYEY